MTDSMNFGPEWIRNLPSEGSTGGGTTAATRYQLADYRYGREEMLVLFDKHIKPPASLTNFKSLYSESTLLPLALTSPTDEDRGWQGRPAGVAGSNRGRGGSLERGRISRGRGGYQLYGRPAGYDSGWGNGEQSEWSPRKEYSSRTMSMENWRRGRTSEEEDGWRSNTASRGMSEKWGRSTSWRGEGDSEERSGPPERGGRQSWHDVNRGPPSRRSWENEDHLPEWATENPIERRGTFDERGAFHGSDDEQLEGKSPNKREMGLQKSVSQQHIINKPQHSQLSSSKSTMSLIKMDEYKSKEDNEKIGGDEIESSKESGSLIEQNMPPILKMPERLEKEVTLIEKPKSDEGLPVSSKINDKFNSNGPVLETITNREEEDFERLQEDLVQKLMVDEEPLKQTPTTNSFDVNSVQPPPNLAPPVQDKWFYQDPQGQMQGPFVNLEMAEWYKAGYFSNQLKVRRQCDDRFFLLGDLITMSGGANPFQSGVRYPAMKNDVSKVSDQELFQMQYYSQMAAFKQAQARVLAEPWSPLNLQQQELSAQRLILQQQQQVPQDLQFLQQPPPPTNPLMHIVNQMQQNSKLPVPGIVEKPGASMPNSLDPHLQMHMGAILMPNRLATGSLPNHLPGGLPGNLPANLPPEGLSSSLPSLQPTNALSTGLPISTMQNNLPAGLNSAMNLPRPTSHGSVDQLSQNNPVSNPIISLLKQLQQQKEQTQKMDSFWQQNFINSNPAPPHPPNWQSQQQDVPLSLWDVQQQQQISAISPGTQSDSVQIVSSPEKHSGKIEKDKQSDMQRSKEDHLATIVTTKDAKKKKELDEKQTKKEAEEKRKQEQRKLEADKRIAEEKRKKDEERVRKELEKVKKEAEDKRLKELEEKRRLKEQRRQEEEAKRKSEETRKTEEERMKRESKEQEERRQAEEKKIAQEQLRIAKAAPWSQSGTGLGMSLADIQKSEREKRAQDAALQLQRQQLQEQQQQQQHQEKPTGIQLSWAKKPVEPRKVKSLAQIQAEEQERLAKQAAEARLQKEKEQPPVINTGNIWSSQSLTWVNIATSNAASQWSTSNTTGGFWDESSQKQIPKPSTVSKSNSTNAISSNVPAVAKQPSQKQVKGKTKKEETSASTVSSSATVKTNHNNNNNGPSQDEFTNWCYKTLGNISTNVDIPTFVTFLRDIESAFDIKEYCKEYLGDSTATQQFATNFVEKRRSYKSKNNAHKDDMCSPAPVTPYLQHSSEFQEVKGKNKKNKKSKMLKVDSRILGFNVTSAPDRINVGDRDYGDNS